MSHFRYWGERINPSSDSRSVACSTPRFKCARGYLIPPVVLESCPDPELSRLSGRRDKRLQCLSLSSVRSTLPVQVTHSIFARFTAGPYTLVTRSVRSMPRNGSGSSAIRNGPGQGCVRSKMRSSVRSGSVRIVRESRGAGKRQLLHRP